MGNVLARKQSPMALAFLIIAAQVALGEGEGLECITDLGLPRYTHIARRSAHGGTVETTVTVGKFGRPMKTEIRSSDNNLAEEVKDSLERDTVYAETCEGRQIQLIFTFELKGKAEWDPPVWVRFKPPNHFFIISRPKKPNID